MSDRIQYDGDQLDEVVLSDCMFHIERMGHHGWWMAAYRDGKRISFWFSMSHEPVVEMDCGQVDGVETIHREPLAYWCQTAWTSRTGDHQCEIEKPHKDHRCECGAVRRVRPCP